jgi:hypothetical protein
MAAEMHATDLLSHINLDSALSNLVKLKNGCVTILDELGVKLELCWETQDEAVEITVKMDAFGRSIALGNLALQAGQSTTLNGHIDNLAKAEVTIEIESDPLGICFEATGCVKPFVGSWHCAKVGKHCINI